MKIGIDASRAFSAEKTGVEWYSYHVLRHLLKNNSFNTDYCLYVREKVHPLPEGENAYVEQSIKRLYWPPKFLWTHGRLSLEMIIRQPDILFVPSHTLPLISARNSVITIHDLAFEYFPDSYSSQALSHQRWAVRHAVKHARRIIAISQNTRKDLIKLYNAAPEKVSVVYNGFDHDEFKPMNPAQLKSIRETYIPHSDESTPIIAYTGRIEIKKNIINLLSAFEKVHTFFPDAQLVLIGKPGYGYEEVQKHPALKRLRPLIHELGYVSQAELPKILNLANLFVLPSFYEGFGIPILEAMACGVPVAASQTSSIPEVVGDAAVLFDPNHVGDIADKIIHLLKTNELRRELIEKGFEQSKKFSWEKCAKETEKVLLNIKN